MVRDNIVIKINNQIADYDDNTAIGITFSSFNPSEIDSIFLNTTNEFTLPITPNNKRIFAFAENTSSNPNMVYDKTPCYIYQDGVSILRGECYLNNITDRYNVQFIEGKNVFDKLKELPFAEYQGDEYPNSLMNLFAHYWNDNIIPAINRKYGEATTAKQMLDNVVSYCNEIDSDGYPLNNVVIPICDNAFGKKAFKYANNNESKVYDNNIYSKSTSTSTATGMILGAKFPSGAIHLEPGPEGSVWQAYLGDDYHNKDYNPNTATVSPIWTSVSVLISILEEYTGYEFYNLDGCIRNILGTDLFCRCNGVEFAFKLYVHILYGSGIEVEQHINWDGQVFMLKGIRGWYGVSFDGEKLNDVCDITEATSLDFIKMLMQEFNLTCSVDIANKRIEFMELSNLRVLSPSTSLDLTEETNKKFSIDGIKQKQAIDYKTVGDNAYVKTLLLTSSNKNIDEGGTDAKLLTIDRYIFGVEDYYVKRDGRDAWFSKNMPIIGNEQLKEICLAVPRHTDTAKISDTGSYVATDEFKRFCIYASWRTNTAKSRPVSDDPTAVYTSDNLECIVNNMYINTLYQPTVGKHNAYEYYQSIIDKPIVEEVKTIKDVKFLRNWRNLKKVKINGLAGVWYVQEISKYNPRVDDTMTLKVIKLPADTAVYYTLELNVEPVGAGIVTGAGTYASDELVRVTATPNDGWYFKKWSDDVLSNIRDVYMDSDKNLTAMFDDIPAGYKKVEYLQSTGTQYIQLQSDNTDFKIDFDILSMGGYYFGNSNCQLYTHTTNAVRLAVMRNWLFSKTIGPSLSDCTFTRDGDFNQLISDGQEIGNANFSYDCSGDFLLFGGYTYNDELRYATSMRVRLFEGFGYNLLPVVRESDNKPGMYDKLSGQFLTNQGTGEFIVGPDIE